MLAIRSVYHIGVYKPDLEDMWRWHFDYEEGVYLSEKYRLCKLGKSAEFTSPDDARNFFHAWKGNSKYKMEIIESKKRIEVNDPVFPKEHPNTIYKKICVNESNITSNKALVYFLGQDPFDACSKSTFNRCRKIFLKYGVDIKDKPKELYVSPRCFDDNEWHISKLVLDVIK